MANHNKYTRYVSKLMSRIWSCGNETESLGKSKVKVNNFK